MLAAWPSTLRREAARAAEILLAAGFAASLALAHSTSAPFHSTGSVIDLRDCAWHGSEGASASRRGELLELNVLPLARPAARTVSCWLRLPAKGPLMVEGTNHGAVTEDGWTFSFERRNGSRAELYHGSQEGRFHFPLPGAWSHAREIGVLIGIPGDNPGYLHLPLLKFCTAPEAALAAPQPLAPLPTDSPTPAAADFFWAAPSVAEVSAYDLEYRDTQGSQKLMHLPAYFESDAERVSPLAWLPPGRVAWRVRAINLRGGLGPWSPWTNFDVQPPSPPRLPVVAPNGSHPLLLMDLGGADAQALWQEIPADIGGHLLLRTGGSVETVEKLLEADPDSQIPLALQVNGPHDVIGGRWDRLPLVRVREWAEHHPNLKAFYICEQAVQGGIRNPEVRDYLRRLIVIAEETGRPVIWADANWGRNVWLDVLARSDFCEFLRAHPGYILPVWKMNGGFVPYLAPSGLLGLWLSQSVTAWGVQPESWYWVEAGFQKLSVQRDYKQGVRTDAPPVIFEQLALLGASAGAAIYSFEPGEDLFAGGLGRNQALQTIFVPLARLLLDSAIPSRPQVRHAVIEWRFLRPGDLSFRKNYVPALRQLFASTLGIQYPFEEIPESGACYWIPFVNPAFPIVGGNHPPAPSRAEPSCAIPLAGRAAVFRIGSLVFVLNSRVNWPENQRFSFEISRLRWSGVLGLNGWLAAKEINPREIRLWFHGREGAAIELDFARAVAWKPAKDGAAHWSRLPAKHLEFIAGAAMDEILVQLPRE